MNEQMFLNYYHCDRCKHEWEDEWSAMCDDDCPNCGNRHLTPYKSDDLGETEEIDAIKCTKCGTLEYINLIDGVLDEDGEDTGQLCCIACYPTDGWCPTGGNDCITKSIAPHLKPLYERWMATHPTR
jgi:DNA-directed RNA polymerase subunit RPC12/RpoP